MRYHGGKGDAPRPIANQEQFEKNWDLIFGKKEKKETCTFCNTEHDPNFECDEKYWFRENSEARYLESRRKRLGFDDGWRGD